ncbi:hypothetical protein [Ferrovibrio sp.]|uniref:hypothetical protein n=1 Tax=Ferrovibrio sp. TaxID=1917215 RepID=UPI003918F3D3
MEGNFTPDYHELTSDVSRSRHQLYADNLQRWFRHLESDAHVFATISSLERLVDFDSWYKECQSTVRSMVGSGTLSWPHDQRARLGMHLTLFRKFSTGDISPFDFCTNFLYSDNNFSVMISDINMQIFEPFSRDLIKYLIRNQANNSGDIPASDRSVAIDHNSQQYHEAVTALSEVENLVRESNEISPDDREMRTAEIIAGKTLLGAVRVRLSAIVPVLLNALQRLFKNFADRLIGIAAGKAVDALLKLLGYM